MTVTQLLYRKDPTLKSCQAKVVITENDCVLLDQTVFFATSGGQPGDTGKFESQTANFSVINTSFDDKGLVKHQIEGVLPKIGEVLNCVIDWQRRYQIMRTHTAMHLLCAAVNEVVTGSNLTPLRGRIDFDLPEPPARELIDEKLAEFVARDAKITTEWRDWDYLDSHPELIKTMTVKPPRNSKQVSLVKIEGIDLQACGGTHVASTSQVGKLRVSKIEKKGKLNRRIVIVLDE